MSFEEQIFVICAIAITVLWLIGIAREFDKARKRKITQLFNKHIIDMSICSELSDDAAEHWYIATRLVGEARRKGEIE